METLIKELDWIEQSGYDTVLQFCHPNEAHGIEGGHTLSISKPSGQIITWVKAGSKADAVRQGIEDFKKRTKLVPNGILVATTDAEKIANGICLSDMGVDHCQHCVDCCKAAHFKIALKDLTK